MNDIFEMQVNIHFFRLSLIRSTESTTVGDCRDISFINNHKTGVEGFRGEEKTAGGWDGLERACKVFFYLYLQIFLLI